MDPNYPQPNAPPPAGMNPNIMPGYPDQPYPPPAGYPPVGYPPPDMGHPPGTYTQGYPPTGVQGYPPQGYPQTGPPGYPPSGAPGYPPPPGGYPAPIAMQPVATSGYAPHTNEAGENWMPRPVGPACPPGLEYLTLIDQLLVHQKVEGLEAFLGFETKNKYSIKNNMGQKIYTAKEDTDCCTRNCIGRLRPFDMKIKDNSGNEVIHLYRPFRCDSCLCPCCLQKMEVMAPRGNVIGTVTQEWSLCTPQFSVQNAAGDTVLHIEGPMCAFNICGVLEFKILSLDKSVEVGKIVKQWSGLLREVFTDADHFGITFPMDLDVNMKAVMLGACFLIDFMYFERDGNKDEIGVL